MSKTSWQTHLQLALFPLLKADPPGRIAILGIGSELDGDDALGPSVIKQLEKRRGNNPKWQVITLIDTGPVPESFTGTLRQLQPDLVLLVDAADLGAQPGEIHWLPWGASQGFSASSHTLPLSMFSSYLTHELDCRVALLGVQTQSLELGADLSTPVCKARDKIVRAIDGLIELSISQ